MSKAPSLIAAARAAMRPSLPDDFQVQGVEDLDKLRPSPTNPRKHFPKDEIEGLAESFRSAGVLTPLLIRPISNGKPATFSKGKWNHLDHFEVVDGERRYRAAKEAGLQQVPVIVRNLTDDQVRVIQLITFAQRADLKPSEEAAAYQGLAAAGKSAEQIAAEVGKPLGFVRSLLRLGKLPAWALEAVDLGILPRATAELVARVPGEASREKVAACVLLCEMWPARADIEWAKKASGDTLSYRDTRYLIQQSFTRELKTAPFERKVPLMLVPEATSCDECPKRAGNDPEAAAEGVRADTCMDPDCYRKKEDAYRHEVETKCAANQILPANLDAEGFERPPRGWMKPDEPVSGTDLSGDFAGYQGWALKDKLPKEAMPQKYFAWGKGGKVVYLVKTSDARKALIEAKVLKPKAKERGAKAMSTTPPKAEGPSQYAISSRAAVNACRIMSEYAAEQCTSLGDLEDAKQHGPIHDVLRFIVTCIGRDHFNGSPIMSDVAESTFNVAEDADPFDCIDAKIEKASSAELLAMALRLSVSVAIEERHTTLDDMLDWAELDWDQLKEQAERELKTGITAEQRLDAAEAALDKPPVGTLAHAVWHVCHRFEDAEERWAKLRSEGATDAELRARLEQEMSESGGSSGPGYEVSYKRSGLKFWHNSSCHKGKPSLAGAQFVAKVREVLGIPQKAKVPA